jgi:hypothetical protein
MWTPNHFAVERELFPRNAYMPQRHTWGKNLQPGRLLQLIKRSTGRFVAVEGLLTRSAVRARAQGRVVISVPKQK